FAAVVGADAVEHAFGAVDVNQIAIDDRAAARAVVVAVLVAIVGRVLELPDEFTTLGLEARQPCVALMPVEDEHLAAADHPRTIAGAELLVPDDLEPSLRPRRDDALLRRHARAEGAEEFGPIVCAGVFFLG